MSGLVRCTRMGIAGLLLMATAVAVAGDDEVEFSSLREASLRNKSRVVMQGLLISFGRDKAVLEVQSTTDSSPQRVEVKMSQIAALRTSDGEFQYMAGDDLDQALAAARKLDQTPPAEAVSGGGQPAKGGSKPSSTITDPDDPFGNMRKQARLLTGNQGEKPDDAPSSDPNSQRKPGGERPTEFTEAAEVILCGNCNKEVALTSKYGQKCPHCGIEWAIPVAIPQAIPPNPDRDAIAAAGPGGMAGNGGQPQRGNGQPRGPQPFDVPPPPAPNLGMPEEMNFANLPLWMKASLFIGSIAVMYYLFFVRR